MAISTVGSWYSRYHMLRSEELFHNFKELFGVSDRTAIDLFNAIQAYDPTDNTRLQEMARYISAYISVSDFVSSDLEERISTILGRTLGAAAGASGAKEASKKKKKKKKTKKSIQPAKGSLTLEKNWQRFFPDQSVEQFIAATTQGAPSTGEYMDLYSLVVFEIEREIRALFDRYYESNDVAQRLIEMVCRFCATTAPLGDVARMIKEKVGDVSFVRSVPDNEQDLEEGVYQYSDERKGQVSASIDSLVAERRLSNAMQERVKRTKCLFEFFHQMLSDRELHTLKDYKIAGSSEGKAMGEGSQHSAQLLVNLVGHCAWRFENLHRFLNFNGKVFGHSFKTSQRIKKLTDQAIAIHTGLKDVRSPSAQQLVDLHHSVLQFFLTVTATIQELYSPESPKERPYPLTGSRYDKVFVESYLNGLLATALDLIGGMLFSKIQMTDLGLLENVGRIIQRPMHLRSMIPELERERLVIGNAGRIFAALSGRIEAAAGLAGNEETVIRICHSPQAQLSRQVWHHLAELGSEQGSKVKGLLKVLGLITILPEYKKSVLADAEAIWHKIDRLLQQLPRKSLVPAEVSEKLANARWMLINFLELYTSVSLEVDSALVQINERLLKPLHDLSALESVKGAKKSAKVSRAKKARTLPSPAAHPKGSAKSKNAPSLQIEPVVPEPTILEKEAGPVRLPSPAIIVTPPAEELSVEVFSDDAGGAASEEDQWDVLRSVAQKVLSPAGVEDSAFTAQILTGCLRQKSAFDLSCLRKSKVMKILEELDHEGWKLSRTRGDHHIYEHPHLIGHISIPFTSKSDTISNGVFSSLAETAGWRNTGRGNPAFPSHTKL